MRSHWLLAATAGAVSVPSGHLLEEAGQQLLRNLFGRVLVDLLLGPARVVVWLWVDELALILGGQFRRSRCHQTRELLKLALRQRLPARYCPRAQLARSPGHVRLVIGNLLEEKLAQCEIPRRRHVDEGREGARLGLLEGSQGRSELPRGTQSQSVVERQWRLLGEFTGVGQHVA